MASDWANEVSVRDFNEVECHTNVSREMHKHFWDPQKPKVSGTPKMFYIFQCARNSSGISEHQLL